MPRLSMFLGKGGVGKTTVSTAYALHRVHASSHRVALLSSDPAHSLADILQYELGDEFREIPIGRRKTLSVAQIDSQPGLEGLFREETDELLKVVASGTFFEPDDVRELFASAMPGIAEVAALFRIQQLLDSREFDEIVVDTAPMGHTLRLLALPETLLRVLDFLDAAASRDSVLAEHFGGRTSMKNHFVTKWTAKANLVRDVLRSGDAGLFMVSSPELFSLEEIRRAAKILGRMSPPLEIRGFVLNRVPEAGTCARCLHLRRKARTIKQRLQRLQSETPVLIASDDGSPVIGVKQLLAMGDEIFSGRSRPSPSMPKSASLPETIPTKWPVPERRLNFTLGKGGVGKTTVSATLGLVSAKHQRTVVCSTDPASSLDDVFLEEVGAEPVRVLGSKNLTALSLDAEAEYRDWAERLKHRMRSSLQRERAGIHVELSLEFETFSTMLDIVPPGLDEIFAVTKIADLSEKADSTYIVDMAPTGHALELLRTPEHIVRWSRIIMKALARYRATSAAQDIAVEVATMSQRVRALDLLLRDDSDLCAVMLPEPLPDRETMRLFTSLDAMNLTPTALFVNRILVRKTACFRCRRASAWQSKTLSKLYQQHQGLSIYLLPEFGTEIAGRAKLERFQRKIHTWR